MMYGVERMLKWFQLSAKEQGVQDRGECVSSCKLSIMLGGLWWDGVLNPVALSCRTGRSGWRCCDGDTGPLGSGPGGGGHVLSRCFSVCS